ncbi:MG406 family protein [Williamsoniiplasma somnilux]|nr:MG406 family protein [Williamsoniiplasma somnilux]
MNRLKKLNKAELMVYALLVITNLISLIVLLVLVGTKTIQWNWITGYLLGATAAMLAIFVMKKAVAQLMKTENHYLYYFMYVVRVGIYMIPLLLAFLFKGTPFYIMGVLIGLVPVILFPFFNGILLKQNSLYLDK